MTSARDRQRLRRARQKEGKVVLRVEVDEAGLGEVMREVGFLHPLSEDDREALARAVEEMLARMVAVTVTCDMD